MTPRIFAVMAIAVMAVPSAALSSPLLVTSYAMNNGGTGSYIYQDTTYSNCPAGSCTTTGAALSGGTGRLTNGVPPTTDWNVNSNAAGWVGWSTTETNGTNPSLTFNFNGGQTISSVSFVYDNSLGAGGVAEPGSVSIDGINHVLAANTTAGPQSLTVSGLSLTGSNAVIKFFQGAGEWIMLGQVSFNGNALSIPEPATLWLLICGVVGLGLARRRRTSA